eukprot:5597875-Pleurochrysis_carterae.AAC.6
MLAGCRSGRRVWCIMPRGSIVVVCLLALTVESIQGYDKGEDITLCWVWQPNGPDINASSQRLEDFSPVQEDCGGFDVVVDWPAKLIEQRKAIFYSSVHTSLRSPPVYAAPREDAPQLATISDEQQCGSLVNIVHVNIHSCE